MNNLIQVIKVLESDEVKKLNDFIDTLDFKQNTLMGSSDFIDDKMRSSTGSFLDDDHELTKSFHLKINQALDEYKRRLINIHENFQYYPVPGGYNTYSWRESIQVLQYEKNQEKIMELHLELKYHLHYGLQCHDHKYNNLLCIF